MEVIEKENLGLTKCVKSNKKRRIVIITIISCILLLVACCIYQIYKFPVVDYKGEKVENVEVGSTYVDKGIKAYSKFKDITDKVIVKNNVDTSKIGNYTVIYNVPYISDYKTYTRSVKVVDTQKPEIKLIGDSEYKQSYGIDYKEPRVYCGR